MKADRPFLIAAFLFGVAGARADILVSVEPVPLTTNAGTTGNILNVLLTNTGAGSISVDSFSFEASTSNPDIVFTSADTSTALEPYIFAGNSLFGPVISTAVGQSVLASDIGVVPVTVAGGGSVGLGRLLFNVTAGASPGSFPVTLDPIATSLSDPAGAAIPITLAAGDIVIAPINPSVPEPSSQLLFVAAMGAFAVRWGLGGPALSGVRRARRRSS